VRVSGGVAGALARGTPHGHHRQQHDAQGHVHTARWEQVLHAQQVGIILFIGII